MDAPRRLRIEHRQLLNVLSATAQRLRRGAPYSWGHFGSCNCGHLAQTITHRSPAEIHRIAVERAANWGELAVDHCPSTGYPADHVVEAMLELGLTREELAHLEELTDPRVLGQLPRESRHLRRNDRAHLILYLETWADLLAETTQTSGLKAARHKRVASGVGTLE